MKLSKLKQKSHKGFLWLLICWFIVKNTAEIVAALLIVSFSLENFFQNKL
jgi:hypothetical protein